MTQNLYIDIHIIQTIPPSNLNRDDNGTPKNALYGGVRRARVSSQAWKRATRTAFADSMPTDQLGVRTKQIGKMFAARIAARTGLGAEQSAVLAAGLLAEFGIKPGKKDGDTAYLLFFGRNQVEEIVSLVADRAGELAALDAKALKAQLGRLEIADQLIRGHPVDVALFGRMVADIPGLNVDAAVQVAHAISTHPVDIEFDYYTAVDDENPKQETGAGMIGTIEFNSATLYRYATLGAHLLAENLESDEAVCDAACAFVDAFIRSVPHGHANGFAHRTLPDLVAVSIRRDQPVNLVSAYEQPVYGGVGGIAAESAVRLAEAHEATRETWSLAEATTVAGYTFVGKTGAELAEVFGPSAPLKSLLATVRAETAGYLAGKGAQ